MNFYYLCKKVFLQHFMTEEHDLVTCVCSDRYGTQKSFSRWIANKNDEATHLSETFCIKNTGKYFIEVPTSCMKKIYTEKDLDFLNQAGYLPWKKWIHF